MCFMYIAFELRVLTMVAVVTEIYVKLSAL